MKTRETYHGVKELTKEELIQLKTRFYIELTESDPNKADALCPNGVAFADEIPDEVVFEEFSSVQFVDDDFNQPTDDEENDFGVSEYIDEQGNDVRLGEDKDANFAAWGV